MNDSDIVKVLNKYNLNKRSIEKVMKSTEHTLLKGKGLLNKNLDGLEKKRNDKSLDLLMKDITEYYSYLNNIVNKVRKAPLELKEKYNLSILRDSAKRYIDLMNDLIVRVQVYAKEYFLVDVLKKTKYLIDTHSIDDVI